MSSESDERARAVFRRGRELLTLDHFAALGVGHGATRDEVHQAFVEAVKTWHPDRVPAGNDELRPLFTQVFARLETARATLSDPNARLIYLGDLKKATRPATGAETSQAEAALEYKKAEVLLKKNDVKQAERHLQRAVQLAPQVVDYAGLLFWLEAKPTSTPEELARLIGELDALVQQDERSAKVRFYRAQLLKRVGRDAAARTDFERAAELDPKNIDAAREVRLYAMRQAAGPKANAKAAADGAGPAGFFRRLFKR